MVQAKSKLNRRNFILAVGAGGAATVAAVAVKAPAQKAASPGGSGKRATRGYATSEHIDNYYRTTKV